MIAKVDKNIVSKENKKLKKSKKLVVNGDVSPDANSNRLTKEQQKQIEAQADDEAGTISKEVGELLAHLKKEHSLSDDDSTNLTEINGKKKKKAKKGKLTDASLDSESKWQGTKSIDVDSNNIDISPGIVKKVSSKQANQKRKKHDLDEKPSVNELAESLSTVPKKKKKKSDGIQVTEEKPQINKKNLVKIEPTEIDVSVPKKKIKKEKQNSPAKIEVTKLAVKKEKKKKVKSEASVKSEQSSPAKVDKKHRKISIQEESDEHNVAEVSSSTIDDNDENAEEKRKSEYYLKNAFPIYVGNLPVNIKKKRIIKLFQSCGKILTVRLRTNTGKNFMKREQLKKVPFIVAFVYFATEEAAEASLKLTGEKIGEHIIYVDRDLDEKDKKSKINVKTTIFVGNLKYQTTNAILQDTFQCCGEIEYVRTIQCKYGCKGTAYVCFKKPESVDLAMKLNKTLVLDREIRVERFHTKKLGGGKSYSKDVKSELKGAALRVAKKSGHESSGKSFTPNAKGKDTKIDKKKKVFLGSKSNAKKKKFDPKKKVKVNAMKKLANKIAPKSTSN